MHLFWLIAVAIVLVAVVGPIIAVVLLVQHKSQSAVQESHRMVLSEDGNWWWDGYKWATVISADGRWRWNGREWQTIRPPTAS
jgi:hypothetical protein